MPIQLRNMSPNTEPKVGADRIVPVNRGEINWAPSSERTSDTKEVLGEKENNPDKCLHRDPRPMMVRNLYGIDLGTSGLI